ncbi:MAG: M20 aminoacylase family protein [Pseudomonadota bacterium]
MPVLNSANEAKSRITEWRRHIHENPGILYEVEHTAAFVADKLRSFGVDEVVEGIGHTGLVGIIHGRRGAGGKTIGLRADMDALPIHEASGKEWASKTDGKMHACGHDGHTAMLLGAAEHLATTRNFEGSIAVIFQPAEEGGAGGKAMVDDGMIDRFGISEVYGMHNLPGLPVGEFAICSGAIMAATDEFKITIHGRGGHAAMPHETVDPITCGASMVQALQTVAARNVDPMKSLVLSVTQFHAGDAYNVIPASAVLVGTIRTLDKNLRALGEQRMRDIATAIAEAHGASVEIDFRSGYPVTYNHDAQTDFAVDVASSVAGADRVNANQSPMMGGEDFSYMLEERPGAFIFVGNGDTAGLHHPKYDFNDDTIPHGVSYWVALAEKALPAGDAAKAA